MTSYTQAQLQHRNIVLKSQLQFGKFLNADIIHVLINLFDDNYTKSTDKISKYISDERRRQGLNDDNVTITGKVYDIDNSTLLLEMYKRGIPFLHFTIHLSINNLKPTNAGMIHMVKNVYKSKVLTRKERKLLYALIGISQPTDRPNSLVFSIADEYNTPTTVPNVNMYNSELQREMTVIITVLNRLFDETNTEFYVGHMISKIPIHNNVNNMLTNINAHNRHYTRKNKGKLMFQHSSNTNPMHINYSKYKLKQKKNPLRPSRKVIRKRSNNT